MEDYEGPVVIRMKPTYKKKTAPQQAQFAYPPEPKTEPLTGFSNYTLMEGLFDLPPITKTSTEGLEELQAEYQVDPKVRQTLKLSKLQTRGGYTLNEIKVVLYLHGVTIPKGTTKKSQYIEVAKKAGVVTKL